jgi:hypothetical protein
MPSVQDPKSNQPVIGLRRLAAGSIKFFGRNAKKLMLVAAVVAVPSTLLRLAMNEAPGDISAYLFLASVFTNLALIWAIKELDAGRPAKVKLAYYKGTASVVPFILVTFVLTFQSIPFLLGMILFVLGAVGSNVSLSLGENLLLGGMWAVLSLPTVYWLNRYLLAIFAAAEGQPPMQALKTSKIKVKGSSWRVLGRQGALAIAIIGCLLVPTLLAQQLDGQLLLFVMQLVTSIVILPLALVYLYKLYQDLK